METSAHFATTNKVLILYSASWCEYCQKVKNYLDQHKITYENRDIESTDTTIQQLFQTLGATGIPQILIGNKVIRGADLEALETELKKQQLL
ncbi:glutaredoxin family protein [Rheinheimera sp. SA_1]|uniref:glutaredoxin family protein n=1 Tax=Rheinheimera sp. SA_1 TaxID=1827365 RepID=UPI0018D41395|nr:glutaredoxin family protein [Rheinheimera sp. SA_1]